MSWLYESFSVKSAKNGRINCSRWRGKWTVTVSGFYETSPYTNEMWRQTLNLLPPFDIYKNVLLLGLGAGGIISIINEKFPSAKITAVEWDPAMIQLAKKLKIIKNPERINIIEADAFETVSKFAKENERFDLIIVDLFKGGDLDKSLSQKEFFQNLKKLLRSTGYLLVNAFREAEKITQINTTFLLTHAIKFKYNYLAVFQPPLPEGYLHQREYRAYLEREAKIRKAISFIQGGKDLGLRATFGPLKIDHFFGDNEPEQKKEGLRIVTWQRITRQDRPHGWHRSWGANIKRMGLADLHDGENYWEHWTDHAKRHREKWLKQRDEWEVYEPTPEEFIKAYKPSKKDRLLTTLYSGLLRDKLKGHGPRVRLFGIRKSGSTKIEAGFACLDIPEANQSLHFISFIYKSARKSPVGVGLMDEWLKSLQASGIRFADFGTFWAPKDPRAWLGFSRFKAQFNIRFIDYPPNLWRIAK